MDRYEGKFLLSITFMRVTFSLWITLRCLQNTAYCLPKLKNIVFCIGQHSIYIGLSQSKKAISYTQ
jgi:hypothetical protein